MDDVVLFPKLKTAVLLFVGNCIEITVRLYGHLRCAHDKFVVSFEGLKRTYNKVRQIDCLKCIASVFPFLQWIRQYSVRQHLPLDLISGITVAIMHIPQVIIISSDRSWIVGSLPFPLILSESLTYDNLTRTDLVTTSSYSY